MALQLDPFSDMVCGDHPVARIHGSYRQGLRFWFLTSDVHGNIYLGKYDMLQGCWHIHGYDMTVGLFSSHPRAIVAD